MIVNVNVDRHNAKGYDTIRFPSGFTLPYENYLIGNQIKKAAVDRGNPKPRLRFRGIQDFLSVLPPGLTNAPLEVISTNDPATCRFRWILQYLDTGGIKKLTPEEEAIGLALGILDETDFEGSVANEGEDESWFEKYSRTRKPSDNEVPDLTKPELVRRAIEQKGKCWVHGGSLEGYSQRGNRGIIPIKGRVVQFHYPSKAAASDAGFILTKDHIHAACKVCNDLMSDAFGVSTTEEEMRHSILRKAAGRKIEFLEPSQVVSEEVLIKKTIYKRA